ncbi:MAG: PepSY domain-containing protein [Pseudomonadota bacterium]
MFARLIYRAIWRWHFWSGLIITPVFLVVCVTGALYVFEPEIRRWQNPERHFIDPNARAAPNALEAFVSASREQLPDYYLRYINVPCEPELAWEGIAQLESADGSRHTLFTYFDPAQMKWLGTHDNRVGFFAVVLQLHRNLMLGLPGRILVETATCWGIISLLAGIYLWWPRKKEKFWGVWAPRWRGRLRKVLRDWHNVPSFYLAPVSIVLLVSGLLFTQIWGLAYRSINLVTGGFPDYFLNPPTSSTAADGSTRISVDTALLRAEQYFDFSNTDYSIEVPKPGSDAAFLVITDTGKPLKPMHLVFLDQFSGETLLYHDSSGVPLRTRITLLFYPVHVGSIFGLPTKVLALLSSIVLAVGAITGVWMWWVRRAPGSWGTPRPANKPLNTPALTTFVVVLAILLPTVGLTLLLIMGYEFLKHRLQPITA